MPKKYILRSFAPGKKNDGQKKRNNLFFLSSYGMNQDDSIVKHALSLGQTETSNTHSPDIADYYDNDLNNFSFTKYADILRGSSQEFVPFFSKSYAQRREYLRQFANNGEIIFVLDTIADDAICFDANNYFAYLDVDKIKRSVNASYPRANELMDTCKNAFN